MKITQADASTIRMDCHPIQTNWCLHLCNTHHFYAGSPSWHNPANLSWLATRDLWSFKIRFESAARFDSIQKWWADSKIFESNRSCQMASLAVTCSSGLTSRQRCRRLTRSTSLAASTAPPLTSADTRLRVRGAPRYRPTAVVRHAVPCRGPTADSIRDSIRIRILMPDSTRDSIRMQMADSQVPTYDRHQICWFAYLVCKPAYLVPVVWLLGGFPNCLKQ